MINNIPEYCKNCKYAGEYPIEICLELCDAPEEVTKSIFSFGGENNDISSRS